MKTAEEMRASYKARGLKISAALKARYAVTPPPPQSAEVKERIRAAITGQRRTPEQRARMSAVKREYWATHKLTDVERLRRKRANGSASAKRNRRAWRARRMGAPPGADTQKHCDACGTTDVFEMGKRNHHLDHCHKSGRFRGVLCGFCNVVLGKCEKKPHRFASIGGGLLAYAIKHGCTQ